MFRYLATADLGLDASMQEEVSPVKVLEYMAFGVPFVSFDLPETAALVDGAAVLVPPMDVERFATEIAALLDDPARREQLGSFGRRRVVSELSWEAQAVTYLRVIDQANQESLRGRRARRRRA